MTNNVTYCDMELITIEKTCITGLRIQYQCERLFSFCQRILKLKEREGERKGERKGERGRERRR